MGITSGNDRFVQLSDSRNLSQLIRSNTPHYWSYMKSQADLRGLKSYLSFEGMLAGDPHIGQFRRPPAEGNCWR